MVLRRKPIVLKGGARDVEVAKIKKGKRLSNRFHDFLGSITGSFPRSIKRNYEGIVHEVEVTLKRGKKERKVVLAEKRFRKKEQGVFENLRDPVRQFEIVSELKKINLEKKLGLHILPTVRLAVRKGKKPTIVVTKYEKFILKREPIGLTLANIDPAVLKDLYSQKSKEAKLSLENGFKIAEDAWTLIKDPKTGEPRFYITDFGNISRTAI